MSVSEYLQMVRDISGVIAQRTAGSGPGIGVALVREALNVTIRLIARGKSSEEIIKSMRSIEPHGATEIDEEIDQHLADMRRR